MWMSIPALLAKEYFLRGAPEWLRDGRQLSEDSPTPQPPNMSPASVRAVYRRVHPFKANW